MDFTCVVSPVYVISKGSTLCIIIVDADQCIAWPTV